jgi:RNA polymerase sigma-70 factor (ECF subfamily)
VTARATAYAERDDAELVEAFLGGEGAAFEALVLRHQDRVFSLCVRLLGNRSLGEEAAQEVFVKVYRNLARFRGDSRFSTWLWRVAINHCRNVQAFRARRFALRHDSLDAEIESEDGPGPKRELAADDVSAEDRMLTQERLRLVQQELARLDPLWKEVLLLRDVEGLSYEEIGAALELAPGTVKSRIHRARGELQARLSRRLRDDGSPHLPERR